MEVLLATGGPFIGSARSAARVTVEKDWSLHTEMNVVTNDPAKLPFRWFQRLNNDQVETEIPNIKTISWDRNIDSDAAQCSIAFYNAEAAAVSTSTRRVGTPGRLTWRQRHMNATARWEPMSSEWVDVLIPNALLRTYEGFGGHEKTLEAALADGNLLITGVWLIDEVRVGTDGMVSITCRDMCKLLIEQQMYLPLMPAVRYPLTFAKWFYRPFHYPAVPVYDITDPVDSGPGPEGPKFVTEITMNPEGSGYAILGTDGGVFAYNTPFWGSRGEGAVGTIAGIAARPSGDGYWIANRSGRVAALGAAPPLGDPDWFLYDVSLISGIAATSTGLGYWVVAENGKVFHKGDATHFGDLPPMGPGTKIVDIAARADDDGYWLLASDGAVYAYGAAGWHGNASLTGGDRAVAITNHGSGGYWIANEDGEVFAFGSALYRGGVAFPLNQPISSMAATPSGEGYWLVAEDGGVFTFGDAAFQGRPESPFAARGIAAGPAAGGAGYWIVEDGGHVFNFGEPDHGSFVGGVDQAPMSGMDMDPYGMGYWLCSTDGAVYTFGGVQYWGRVNGPSSPVVRLVAHPNGRGYWLLEANGAVHARGDGVPYLGNVPGIGSRVATDMATNQRGDGYWILVNDGSIYSFGAATYHGNHAVANQDFPGIGDNVAVAMAARPQGDGYWITDLWGHVSAHGAAAGIPTPANGNWASTQANLADPIIGMDVPPDPVNGGKGYLLVGGDGGVFSFGEAPFEGALPTAYSGSKRVPGNIDYFEDAIRDLLMWSGWLLHGTSDVHGHIETTGTYPTEGFPPDAFDKKPVIDGIHVISEIVGYFFWIAEDGGVRWESPNWFNYGNFDFDLGVRTNAIPEITDILLLTAYTASYSDRPARSELIITSDDPTLQNDKTITTRVDLARRNANGDYANPLMARLLRGMVRPAMLPTPVTVTKAEQETMAEQIEIQMTFQLLQGEATCVANPAIQVNDQVRIYEEVSGETDVHYVRGISSTHDLDTGLWLYTLTTNRLGEGRAPGGQITGEVTGLTPILGAT
jgi:hypothetical protein